MDGVHLRQPRSRMRKAWRPSVNQHLLGSQALHSACDSWHIQGFEVPPTQRPPCLVFSCNGLNICSLPREKNQHRLQVYLTFIQGARMTEETKEKQDKNRTESGADWLSEEGQDPLASN